MRQSGKIVYLDYSATTPLHPEVLEQMLPYFTEHFGNPSSVHRLGQQARHAVESSRHKVAGLLNASSPREIIFTGGGTESDNLFIRGVAWARQDEGKHLITSAVEHKAVIETMHTLEASGGFSVTVLPVDEYGQVRVSDVAKALRPDTTLVSIMAANNEVGTLQPIAEIGALLSDHPAYFHVDAVQAGGYLPLDVQAWQVDGLSLSAHKFHGPKGIGVLYERRGTRCHSIATGGGQEQGMRSGTQNVAHIVGCAAAFALAQEDRTLKNESLCQRRQQVIDGVTTVIPTAELTGHPTQRLPGHTSFTMGSGVGADMLLVGLDMEGIAVSSGSACASGRNDPSHVLLAMGVPEERAISALRITLSDQTTTEEIECLLESLPRVVSRLQAIGI